MFQLHFLQDVINQEAEKSIEYIIELPDSIIKIPNNTYTNNKNIAKLFIVSKLKIIIMMAELTVTDLVDSYWLKGYVLLRQEVLFNKIASEN